MSQIRFNNNLSGSLSVDNPSSQQFQIDFYYEIGASCDNVGTDGQDYNDATTTLEIYDGTTWTAFDSVTATVSGGNFPNGQADYQRIGGVVRLQFINNPEDVVVRIVPECDYGRNGKGGDGFVKIDIVSVDTGTCEIICNDTLYTYCNGSYFDCSIPAPTTTTTTTPAGPTTTTTTTLPPSSFSLYKGPEGLLYTRSPIVYRYIGCNTGATYTLKLYTTTQSTLTEYVSFDRKADLLNGITGLTVDISNLLTNYIRDNMNYDNDNIIYFRLDALEYDIDNVLRKTITGSKLIASMGYVDGGAETLPLKSGDVITTTTTTPLPETTNIDGLYAASTYVNTIDGGSASVSYTEIITGGTA